VSNCKPFFSSIAIRPFPSLAFSFAEGALGDQWIAFDDRDTLQEKVKFANDEHLGGLMIWAIDLDDSKNSALDALLQPDGLGKFATQNGVKTGLDDWVRQGAQCQLGACSEKPSCDQGFVKHGHDLECPKEGERRNICCDIRENPDEKTCTWRDGLNPLDLFFDFGPGLICSAAGCQGDEILMVSNDRFWVDNPDDPDGGDARCLVGGKAHYCCKAVSHPSFGPEPFGLDRASSRLSSPGSHGTNSCL
jgi:chitinase